MKKTKCWKHPSGIITDCTGCPVIKLCPSAKLVTLVAVAFSLPVKAHDVPVGSKNRSEAFIGTPTLPISASGLPYAKPGRAQLMHLESSALTKPDFKLRLSGHDLSVHRVRQVSDKESETWAGQVDGESTSDVTITQHAGAIQGVIHRGGRLYELSGRVNGEQTLIEVDQQSLPEDAHPISQSDALSVAKSGEQASTQQTMPSSLGGGVVEDLLVVYTAKSCNRYDDPAIGGNGDGQCDELEARVINSVQSTNQAFVNSGFGSQFQPLQINLLGMKQIDYVEKGRINDTLAMLTNSGGPYAAMDVVHMWRDSEGADMVAMVSEDSDACGTAWSFNGSDKYAFSVVNSGCLSSLSMAHELGHNFGDEHNRENAGSGARFAYSYGFRHCAADGSGFRDIMSYDCDKTSAGVSVPRVAYYSNPNVYFNGLATGVSGTTDGANNALTISRTASQVASFRQAAPTSEPNTPTELSVTVSQDGRALVRWVDMSANESGFRVERSLDGQTWIEVAVLGADATSFLDGGLIPGQNYSYRIRAYNSLGYSLYSSVANAGLVSPLSSSRVVATEELGAMGEVINPIAATWAKDGFNQALKEVIVPAKSTSALQHTWQFNLQPGDGSTVVANVHMAGLTSGQAVKFAYSTNNKTFKNMFTVTSADPNNTQTFQLPKNIKGNLFIRVMDTDRSKGSVDLNEVHVDGLFVQVKPK